jgi:hypothetical protein
MGPEHRIILTGCATALLPVGVVLCMTSNPVSITVGIILVAFSLLLFSSLLFGWPLSSLQADVREGTQEGIPWHAPLDYQIDQLRQIVPHFNGEAFDEPGLRAMIPKARRTRIRPFHEPFENFQWREGIECLLKTGELETISYNCWRATGKKPPHRWLRWKHTKDS